MKNTTALQTRQPLNDVDAIGDLITTVQHSDGNIPWSEGDKTDPWDHVESAVGLTICGRTDEARDAFRWLKDRQLEDGSWYAAYRNGRPEDKTRDTNMTAYIAVGLYHYLRVTGDDPFVAAMMDTMAAAIDFAVSLQQPTGEIYWAISPEGRIDPMALLTGSSSIFMSLKCACHLAERFGRDPRRWARAADNLKGAIRYSQHRFNVEKSRFSMDWFYPVLTGAITGDAARRRIDHSWHRYVVDGYGVRCVDDEPWITIAETCELCLALAAMGDTARAEQVFGWIGDYRYADGTFWCGFTIPDMVIWPEEKITWTNAVALMAEDALYGLTPAGNLFDHRFWKRTAG